MAIGDFVIPAFHAGTAFMSAKMAHNLFSDRSTRDDKYQANLAKILEKQKNFITGYVPKLIESFGTKQPGDGRGLALRLRTGSTREIENLAEKYGAENSSPFLEILSISLLGLFSAFNALVAVKWTIELLSDKEKKEDDATKQEKTVN